MAVLGAQAASTFESLRPHLMSVAYRLTGTVADVEDIVQEAWLRWDAAPGRDDVADLRAWLTTVVSRLGLDKLRSAARRRETYTGHWLPEPVVTGLGDARGGADPLSAVVAAEDARFAVMVVLERLSPDQRVAFVLHDGFAMPFAEVAGVIGASEAAARQLASRARKAVAAAPPPQPDPTHDEVVGRLMAAMAPGDLHSVVSLLHPDVTFTGDANGRAPTAARVICGADKVARFMLGLARRYGPAFYTANQLALVNGELGSYTLGTAGDGGHWAMLPRITAMTVRDGKVCALWDIANPDKFSGSPLRDLVG
ncbi:sigma-70 family RNA polymerase sigma factor [Mycobacterium ulcerans]|nr:sigma-70 family RNA polymerase sigma factor [Mycobacterium ulcerans]MEB3990233.1 sigma-70 family RNA polymerase sigma factor [Mycobacterium ulcerans]MEB4114377.1 sigma-70 family RNA polymerase sigma factor [Mycobacterium ulcerans]MEB4184710.1 sigma-70 family RNA polymerase sigma factor [Mycobacterium ulcerans]MEB4280684.1 sigma-70 family RNA polymerase sigma factor [Mycobacterium ulcerans]